MTFTPSPIFAYIWRILLIILIVYLTLFFIGVFSKKKCCSLDPGTFVKVSPGDSSTDKITIQLSYVNIERRLEPWTWHLKRLYFKQPFWSHQQQEDAAFGLVKLFITSDAQKKFQFSRSVSVYSLGDSQSEEGVIFYDFIKSLKSADFNGAARKSIDVSSGTIMSMLEREGTVLQPNETCSASSGTCYAVLDPDAPEKVLYFVFFVKRNGK